MTTERIILDSLLASLLMGSVCFNYNRVFSRFEFIFSNSRRVRGGVMYCYSCPDPIIF